ncbi:hypothetical protein RFI_22594 [Reticulomyxa filosa]|uniref:Caspase family p20 domain-containing protein n=1 Tax=Reticulomyxa filosa TaxID=46433 RepID=X6MLM0_RETFI|nr:hypothetical protein RFI_22594 [Reticulomyxa filosa]|eukprot:ETO14774.1 hypothetical protein RFI_22594 [Reticulomyxa filosa]
MCEEKSFEVASIPFQSVKKLPTPLSEAQCISHNNEILICGGLRQLDCYSYHTDKDEYKFICSYPSDIRLEGHCVVELVDNSPEIILLSFGGKYKHALIMKYISVWNNANERIKELGGHQWIPFKDNNDNPVNIGDEGDNYLGARAVIGGSNNNLLFIIYYPNNISVFTLNTFKCIKKCIINTNDKILYPCFIANPSIMKLDKTTEMLLFCQTTGLSINYNENNNIFQFCRLVMCDDIAPLRNYAYVCVNDFILFFGGWNGKLKKKSIISNSIYKFSIRENKWTTLQNALPTALRHCGATFNKRNKYIYAIGGYDKQQKEIPQNMKVHLDDVKQYVTIGKIKIIKNALVIMIAVSEYDIKDVSSLPGVKKDIANFHEVFHNELGYTFVFLNYKMTVDNIECLVQILNSQKNLQEYDGLIVIICGHGLQDMLLTSDGKYISIGQLCEIFVSDNLKVFCNLPKIFMVDICRSNAPESSELTSCGYKNIGRGFLIIWSTIKNNISIDNALFSKYIKNVVISKYDSGYPFKRMLEDIRREILNENFGKYYYVESQDTLDYDIIFQKKK